MNAEEFEKEFQSFPEKEQLNVLRKILPAVCRTLKEDPQKAREMFSLLREECGGPMAVRVSMMEMMGKKGGGCCG